MIDLEGKGYNLNQHAHQFGRLFPHEGKQSLHKEVRIACRRTFVD